MARGDKATSWKSAYDTINTVLNMLPESSRPALLNTSNVVAGASIDDTDNNDISSKFNAIKNDSILGSSSQLYASGHTAETVDLFSTTPGTVYDGSLISTNTQSNISTIVSNLSQIKCRNIVTCTRNTTTTCYNDAHSEGCSKSYYSSCNNGYCYCTRHAYCKVFYGSYNECYYFNASCLQAATCNECYDGSYYNYTYGCYNGTTYYDCYDSNYTHNDILCSNNSWSGS